MSTAKETEILNSTLTAHPVGISINDSFWLINQVEVPYDEFIYLENPKTDIYISSLDNSTGVFESSGTFPKPYPYLIQIANGGELSYFMDEKKLEGYAEFENVYFNTECIIVYIYVGNHPSVDFAFSQLAKNQIEKANISDNPFLSQKEVVEELLNKANLIGKVSGITTIVDEATTYNVGGGTEYYPTSDPIVNYKNLQESENSMEITLENVSAGNRTLVIVYGSKDSPSDYKERAARLIGSLNLPDTIKAVVITINGNKIYSGLDFNHSPNPGKPDADMLDYVGKRFVQVLEVRHSGAS